MAELKSDLRVSARRIEKLQRGVQEDGSSAGFKVYGSLFKVDSRYEFLNPLGKGSYGIVCAAKDRETGQRLAIKKVCPMAKRSVDAKHTLREVLLLQLLGKHPNVISIHNLSTNLKDDELYIVMDLMDTDMHRVIQSSQSLSDSHIRYFLHQLLRGVKYLHDNGVLHRDLKPGNLLLTKTCHLKIADFGLARKVPKQCGHGVSTGSNAGLDRPRSAPATSSASSSRQPQQAPMTEHVVTRWYRAPELMLQPDGIYDESVDMWSVGCIFAEILGRKALFPGKNFLHQLTLIFDVIGTPPIEATAKIKSSQAQRFLKSLGKKSKVPFRSLFPNASEDALDLLDKLLEFDPDRRLTAHEALAHPYMQAIEKKYKGVDPHPTARVDFSFDTKKLTKMDLRGLIIKEVETFRKSVSRNAAVDAIGAGGVLHTKLISKASNAESRRPASASFVQDSTAIVPSRVMCGSAGISMIHSDMRQAIPPGEPDVLESQATLPTSSSRPSNPAVTNASVTIGSHRPRIRFTTKPPVPKQMSATPGIAVPDQHGHVRVIDPPPAIGVCEASSPHGLDAPRLAKTSNTDTGTTTGSRIPGEDYAMISTQPQPSWLKPEANSSLIRQAGVPHAQNTICGLEPGGDAVKIAAKALSALELKSKTLMNEARWSATAAATGEVIEHSTNITQRPEVSRSVESSPLSPSCSSESDPESQRIRDATRLSASKGGFTTRVNAFEVDGYDKNDVLRRRVASAGPTRTKPQHISTSTQPTSNNVTQTAFVGSTRSLIRAQRSGYGHSLTESANQMVATMVTKSHDHTQEPRQEQERDEMTSGVGSTLKPQRSQTQLNQQEGAKKLGKKLTVPKSPKFSVMSWQKKKDMSASRLGLNPAAVPTSTRR